MPRIALALTVGGLMLVSAAASAERLKHSGTIISISPNGQTITVEELGVGVAPARNKVIAQPIALTPETRLKLVTRVEEHEEADWPGGFKESPLAVSDLRAGDYATVETESRNGRLTAISVIVVRPTGPPR